MQPVVDRLKDTYGDQVTFLDLDAAGDGKKAFRAGNLPGHPSYVVLRADGAEVWRGFGVLDEADLVTPLREVVE
jgi:hypothetical protein